MSDSDSDERKHLKVVVINGSPHKDGNTMEAINIVRPIIEKAGIEFKIVDLCVGHSVRSCIGCDGCKRVFHCIQAAADDPVHQWYWQTCDCDGLILACPVSFANASTEMLSYIDRVGYMCRHDNALKNKVGASIVACYSTGDTGCFDALNRFFGIHQVYIAGSCGWNSLTETLLPEVRRSRQVAGLRNLAQNIVLLLKKLHPDAEPYHKQKAKDAPTKKVHEQRLPETPAKVEITPQPGQPHPKPLKVVAFNGSFKPKGNTAQLIEIVFAELRKEGIECEMVQIGNAKHVHGCDWCTACVRTGRCVKGGLEGDPVNQWIEKCLEADGIIIGSPTHFANVTTEVKSFIDRVGVVCSHHDFFRGKVGAAVVAVRRGGAMSVYEAINHFFTYSNMTTVTSSYWNEGFGRLPGEVKKDTEGIETMKNLGQNMAHMLKALHPDAPAAEIPQSAAEPTSSSAASEQEAEEEKKAPSESATADIEDTPW